MSEKFWHNPTGKSHDTGSKQGGGNPPHPPPPTPWDFTSYLLPWSPTSLAPTHNRASKGDTEGESEVMENIYQVQRTHPRPLQASPGPSIFETLTDNLCVVDTKV